MVLREIVHVLLLIFGLTTILTAHEIRPAYLEIKQTGSKEYTVLWKVPLYNGKKLDIFPECSVIQNVSIVEEQQLQDAHLTIYKWKGNAGLEGHKITINGLQRTLMDVLIRIDLDDKLSYTLLAQPDSPTIWVPVEPSRISVIRSYAIMGIEHILKGADHLLFVLCLLLIIDRWQLILWTVSSFTLAHSLTLALSVLGIIHLPSPPVETVIALSIMFLAREYLSKLKGRSTLTLQYPWTVAFIFGLVHGLGFSGALQEIGLPQSDVAFALIFFNAGVEIGQVLFIFGALICYAFWAKLSKNQSKVTILKKGMAFAIGGLSSFWFIDRIMQF